jgi:hypothetical protein
MYSSESRCVVERVLSSRHFPFESLPDKHAANHINFPIPELRYSKSIETLYGIRPHMNH